MMACTDLSDLYSCKIIEIEITKHSSLDGKPKYHYKYSKLITISTLHQQAMQSRYGRCYCKEYN